MSNRRTALLLLSLAATAPTRADSILEFQTTEFGGGQPIVGTVQISTSGSDTRVEIISVSSAEAGGMIFHGDRKEMIILDHAQGSYMVIDKQHMDAMAGMPPEQTMQQQALAKPRQRSPDTINDLHSHGEVAGIPCNNYEVIRDGRKIRELCVSDWADIYGGQETANAIKSVADFFEGLRQANSSAGDMDVFDRQQELFEHMEQLDGYPVLYRDFSASGSLERQTLLTGAREESLGSGFFNPPPSYQLQELPQGTN